MRLYEVDIMRLPNRYLCSIFDIYDKYDKQMDEEDVFKTNNILFEIFTTSEIINGDIVDYAFYDFDKLFDML